MTEAATTGGQMTQGRRAGQAEWQQWTAVGGQAAWKASSSASVADPLGGLG